MYHVLFLCLLIHVVWPLLIHELGIHPDVPKLEGLWQSHIVISREYASSLSKLLVVCTVRMPIQVHHGTLSLFTIVLIPA